MIHSIVKFIIVTVGISRWELYKLSFLWSETPLYTKGKRKHFQLYPTIYFDTPCISNYSINCWTRVRYEVHVNDSQTIPTIFAIFNECWKWVFALCHETLVCLTCMHLLIIINSNYENWINLQVRRRMENSIEEEVRYKQ